MGYAELLPAIRHIGEVIKRENVMFIDGRQSLYQTLIIAIIKIIHHLRRKK